MVVSRISFIRGYLNRGRFQPRRKRIYHGDTESTEKLGWDLVAGLKLSNLSAELVDDWVENRGGWYQASEPPILRALRVSVVPFILLNSRK